MRIGMSCEEIWNGEGLGWGRRWTMVGMGRGDAGVDKGDGRDGRG